MKASLPPTTTLMSLGLVMLVLGTPPCSGQLSPNISSSLSNRLELVATDPRGMEMQRAVLQQQDLKEIQRILKSGFKINDPIGCGTFNSVDGAVSVGNVEILKYLLANGAEPKGSALFQAMWHPKPKISFQLVDVLLKAGADAGYKQSWPTNYVAGDTRLPATNRFETPLHSACYLGNAAVVELLLNRPGVELNGLNIDGSTPLMNAAAKGNEKIVKLLLDKGAIANFKNGLGRTAADFARQREDRGLTVLPLLEP